VGLQIGTCQDPGSTGTKWRNCYKTKQPIIGFGQVNRQNNDLLVQVSYTRKQILGRSRYEKPPLGGHLHIYGDSLKRLSKVRVLLILRISLLIKVV
jgi:hypothetical protein